jgi:hypothetical protein
LDRVEDESALRYRLAKERVVERIFFEVIHWDLDLGKGFEVEVVEKDQVVN